MIRKKALRLALVLFSVLALGMTAMPVTASVPPPPPPPPGFERHTFYGTVTVGGSPAADGIVVSAHIGALSWSTTTKDGQYGVGVENLFYVPKDDPATPAKDGGVDRDVITFKVGGVVAATYIFKAGDATALNLDLPEARTLIVDVDPSGSGDIEVNGSSPDSYPHPYVFNHCTDVEVEAIPADECWYFVEWSGDLSGSENPTTIHIDDDKIVTANFALFEYELTIDSTEGGEVTSPGEGTFTYDCGEVVDLVAEAEAGYQFVNWTGDVGTIANVNQAVTTITMYNSYNITANFTEMVEAWLTGVTGEVNCELLGDVLVELFQDGTSKGSTTSGGDGNYSLSVPETGTYDVVASKDGFRDETQTDVVIVDGVNTLHFRGETGLIPNEPNMSYVLKCVNHWLYPPSEECELTMSKVLAVVNAWLYPVVNSSK